MVLKNSNLENLESLINEMRYKSYQYFKAKNHIEDYDDLILDIKTNSNSDFLLEEEFLDLIDNHINIYVYNKRIIVTEDDNILFMVKINDNINPTKYRNWVTLIRLIIGCFNGNYVKYSNDELKLVIKELRTLTELMN